MRFILAIILVVLSGCTTLTVNSPDGPSGSDVAPAVAQAIQAHDQQIQSLAREIQGLKRTPAQPPRQHATPAPKAEAKDQDQKQK